MPHVDHYNDRGERIPSVTEVISIFKSKGMENFANYLGYSRIDFKSFMEEKGEIGTAVHAKIESYLLNTEYTPSPKMYIESKADVLFKVFKNWAEEVNPRALSMEENLCNGRYGGTYDAILQYPDGPIGLVDFKTSTRPRPYNLFQLGGYLNLLEELQPEIYQSLTFVSVLVLGQGDGKIKILTRSIPEMEKYKVGFEQMYQIFMMLKDILWGDWNHTRIVEGWTQ